MVPLQDQHIGAGLTRGKGRNQPRGAGSDNDDREFEFVEQSMSLEVRQYVLF
jgi:hypothetical protein